MQEWDVEMIAETIRMTRMVINKSIISLTASVLTMEGTRTPTPYCETLKG